ncbi:MAG: hypothetical protein IJ088_05100 [Clostridia bacterium]|nr:hypothetical protein [Clostridia bacterium]
MGQTLECIMVARGRETECKKIEACLEDEGDHEIIVDRYRLQFDGYTKTITITRASDDVPFACKIGSCRMPYALMERLLNGIIDNMEGFEWLY